MAQSAEFVVEITANLAAVKAGLAQLEASIKSVKKEAAKPTLASNARLFGIDLDKARAGFSGIASEIRAAAAAYVSFAGVAGLARIADEANTLQARLKLATKSQLEYNIAQAETFRIAQASQVSTAAVVDLYTKTERATRDLGINQRTLIQFTETISKAGAITGGGQALDAAIFQLTQGLASGVLRGQELNSVLEQAPRIAQLIADGLDIPIGSLRKLAEEGKITTQEILKAALSQRKVIDDEFAELPKTIGGAFQRLRNSFQEFVKNADDVNSTSAKVAAAINNIADNLPQIIALLISAAKAWAAYTVAFRVIPGIIGAAIVAQQRWAASTLAVSQAAGVATKSVRLLSLAMKSLNIIVVTFIAVREAFTALRRNFKEVEIAGIYFVRSVVLIFLGIQEAAQKVAEYVPALFQDMWNAIKNFAAATLEFIGGALDAVPGRLGRALQSTADAAIASAKSLRTATGDGSALEQKLADIAAQAAKTREEFIKINDEQLSDAYSGSIVDREKRDAKARQEALQRELDKQKLDASGGAGAGQRETKFNAQLKAVADQNELIIDSIDRALTDLEARYDDNLVSLNEYYAARSALQTASLTQELTAKRQELAQLEQEGEQLRAEGKDNASNIESRSNILTEILKLERDIADVAPAAAREQAAAERELATELANVRTRLIEATGQTAEARRQQIEAEFVELRAKLRGTENEQAGLELIDKLINVEAARANLDALEEEITETLGNLRATEDNISAQIEAGLLGQFRGEEQLQEAREKTIGQLQRYKAALQEAYAAAKDPAIQAEIQKRLLELDTELARVTASTQVLQNQLRDIGQNGLEQFFNDIMSGTKSIGDAFKGLILTIAQEIGKLAARNVAGAISGQLSGAFGGGGGGGGFNFGDLFSKAGSFLSGLFHSGGIVGQAPPARRMVPEWAFAGAPRFHSGGMAGLKPDEVPAILQTGEEVLARNDPRNAANGGGGGFRVVNVLDPKMAGDYLESSEGERVIMNIIGRNPGQVRQLLG